MRLTLKEKGIFLSSEIKCEGKEGRKIMAGDRDKGFQTDAWAARRTYE